MLRYILKESSVGGGTITKVCCPVVESIKIDSFLSCKVCKNKAVVLPGQGMCKCGNCRREFNVSYLLNRPGCSRKTITVDIANNHTAMAVTIFEDVIQEFWGEDILQDDAKLKKNCCH